MAPKIVRDDLSERLIHLVRGESDQAAAQVFLSILKEGQLRGGTGNIKGSFRCVCFSEAPISKLGYLLALSGAHGVRYKPFGIMVPKAWFFSTGGRPVIYQPDLEYHLLHESQRFRHVRYEPNYPAYPIDFTWEREWRIQTEALILDPAHTTVVVPTRGWEERLQAEHMQRISARAQVTLGFTGPSSVTKQPWHFIALEDLGVSMPVDEHEKNRGV